MKKQFSLLMFALCFGVWAIVVDNLVIPPMNKLKSDTGTYSRFRVKEWKGSEKIPLIGDELIVYAHVLKRYDRAHEQMYYMERNGYFEGMVSSLAPGTRIEIRYAKAFPKVWKKKVYEVRMDGSSIMRYSPAQLGEQQKFNWKFTGIMIGAFVVLSALGCISKPRKN